MSSFQPPATATNMVPVVRFSDRVLYRVVQSLVSLSRLVGRRSRPGTGVDDQISARQVALFALVAQLSARDFLQLRDDDLATLSEIKLPPTGSSMNVAIIPEDKDGRALILKFTDSAVASSELATSSDVQEQLSANSRLSSWSSHIPQVLASGMVGTTTFAIETSLSSRDGRAVADDPLATNELMADALGVIGDFHQLSGSRRQVDAKVLDAIVERPIDIMRANTSAGLFRCRARAIERLASWLRRSLVGLDLEVGWTHGDFHLGNVLIDDLGHSVVGVVDWGRAEPDGLTVLDGFTLIVLERAKNTGEEIGSFVLELLREVELPLADRRHSEVLAELQALLDDNSSVDVRCVVLLTWLKHVANNLKNEDRARSHGLWRLRNVDLVLYGVAEIIGS